MAAELTGVHPQTLRIYEAKGLVTPKRSAGNTRLYSQADIDRLELIGQLTDEGINLAGVMRILDLKERMAQKDAELEKLRRQMSKLSDQVHELQMRSTITAMVPVRNTKQIRTWKSDQ